MTFAAILLLALTRAEIIDRMRAAPVTRVDGLVQVIANCPADMRHEFQMPIATFAGDVCVSLYRGLNERQRHFNDPGIVIVIGDVQTNDTRVIVRREQYLNEVPYTRILLPAPAFADVTKLKCEVTKAFYRTVRNEELDDIKAETALRRADPDLRIADDYEVLRKWRDDGVCVSDDESMLKLARKVLQPGVAWSDDILRFASRLYLYPDCLAVPFIGGVTDCSFEEAIVLAQSDPRVRAAARAKVQSMIAFGMGRSREMSAAVTAYVAFLAELADGMRTTEELRNLLLAGDRLLEYAMDKARKGPEGSIE